jgi:hypothetical protein
VYSKAGTVRGGAPGTIDSEPFTVSGAWRVRSDPSYGAAIKCRSRLTVIDAKTGQPARVTPQVVLGTVIADIDVNLSGTFRLHVQYECRDTATHSYRFTVSN